MQNIGFKLAQAYKRINNSKDTDKTIDILLKIYPENKNYLSFKKSLKA